VTWPSEPVISEPAIRDSRPTEQQLIAVRYFTSRVSSSPSNPDQHKRQNTYLEALDTLPDTTIQFDNYLCKSVVCHSCGASWIRQEEKMTEVNIAIALTSDAFANSFDTALLVSADSDLTGPVLQVKQLFPPNVSWWLFPPLAPPRGCSRMRTLRSPSAAKS